MRTLLIIVLCICFGPFSCTPVDRNTAKPNITTVSQDSLAYPKNSLQIPDSLRLGFLENFFRPWTSTPEMILASLDTVPGRTPSYLETYLEDDEWYGENKKNHKRWQREAITNNIDLESFPNFLRRAITISHTNVRRIPTHRPGFDQYSKAGEGYPFDYFQETGLWANTPVLIAHISNDKQWCYTISPYYKGWVALHDLALVDDQFVKTWMQGNFCRPLSDDVVLSNTTSNYAVTGKMGMLLPYQEVDHKANTLLVRYATADQNQNAYILYAEINRDAVALEDFAFNEENIRRLVSGLVGRPYGWGGYLEHRDCSSMIRDFFGTYGIWLPRDSKDQMAIGQVYDFPEATNEKIALIKAKGTPFLTILRKKGHNMLYVGDSANGEPLILHAIWGFKTSYSNEQLADYLAHYPIEGIHQDADGILKGRYIIGETVITPVTVGAGENGVTVPLIDEIYAMTNILEN